MGTAPFILKAIEMKNDSSVLFVLTLWRKLEKDRSSRPEVFCEKVVLKNFGKLTRKHLCQSLFFNKNFPFY